MQFIESIVSVASSSRAHRSHTVTMYESSAVTVPVALRNGPERQLNFKTFRYPDGLITWTIASYFKQHYVATKDFRLAKAVEVDSEPRATLCLQMGLDGGNLFFPSQRQVETAGAFCGPYHREVQTASTLGILVQLLVWATKSKTIAKREEARLLLRGFLRTCVGELANWKISE